MSSSEDAVADFLAREKETLAGIDDFAFENVDDQSEPTSAPDQSESDNQESSVPESHGAAQLPVEETEPDSIKAWRKEQEVRLRKKDEKEQSEMEVLKKLAKQELDDWYEQRYEELEKNKKNNREIEAQFFSNLESVEPGKEWDKISSLCDFNAKSGRNVKDVSRMRSLLLQMKSKSGSFSAPQMNGQ